MGLDTKIDWKHNKLYSDWSICIDLPHGAIRGVVSFANPGTNDFSTWGTIQIGDNSPEMAINKYSSPPMAIDAITRSIISVMAHRIHAMEEG